MKTTFQKGTERTMWLKEVVANPFFDEAITHTFAEYASRLGALPGDEHKVLGAIQALYILKNLPESFEPKKAVRFPVLEEKRY